ncbi:MAG: hypothetical protein Phyf2KO_19330 [Phycisphaerales bacterium]
MSRPAFIGVIGLALGAGAAFADFGNDDYTHVRSPGSEPGHASILSSALGGSFSASGLDFSNGSITAIRNRDSGHYSGDQIWSAGTYNAKIVANHGSADALFGYQNGSSGGHFQTLLDAEDVGSMASTTMDSDFRWAIKVDGFIWDHVYTSREHDNYGKDMMVSYSIFNGMGSMIGSMLFFEDKKHHSDKDFNDVAVFLSVVPTPQAAGMGALALLGGLSMTRRRSMAR